MSSSRNPTVLVVDDEDDLTDMYASQLSGEYDVRKAYSGAEALKKFDDAVSVTLLDRRLPHSSSEKILEQINDHPSECRIALVTAVQPDFDILDMDFDDYVVKPVGKSELRSTVERMLARSDYQDIVREYFTLLSKHAALKTHKTEAELNRSPEFFRLEAEIKRHRGKLDELTTEFDSEDFRLLCRDIA